MSVGNDLLPNVYINNIEIHEDKIKYDIFVLDRDLDPVWSKKRSIRNILKLKQTIVEEEGEKIDLVDGNKVFTKFHKNATVTLVSEMKTGTIENVSGLQGHRYFIKTFEFPIPDQLGNVTIFANLFIEGLSEEGPVMSEDVFVNGIVKDTTNTFVKNGTQYYGSVHLHEGQYMEGKRHSPVPHDFVSLVSLPNLKIKDFRSKKYEIKQQNSTRPIPIFSNLLTSFDVDTNHNFMFFVNLSELVATKTKYGRFLLQLDDITKENLFNSIYFRTITIKKYKLKKNTKVRVPNQSFAMVKSISIGFESQGNSYISTYGDEVEFISHGFGNDIRGMKFVDKEANDHSYGNFQYEIEISFDDKTIELFSDFISRLNFAIESVESFRDFLMRPNKYETGIRKITSETELYSFVANNQHESTSKLINDIKFFLYDMTEEEKQKDLLRNYNMINPKTCTLESLDIFIQEVKLLSDKVVSIFGQNSSAVKANYSQKYNPKSTDFTNRIFIVHKFKDVITPSLSKDHYVYNSEKPTGENLNTSISKQPLRFGRRGNRLPFEPGKNVKIDRLLKTSIAPKLPTPSLTVFSLLNQNPTIETERFKNVTDYMGQETNFNSFTTEEKCETLKEEPEVKTDIELKVVTKTQNVQQEMKQSITELEVMQGFRLSKDNRKIVSEPVWNVYGGEQLVQTSIVKQRRIGDIKEITDYPFPNQYLLLNNKPEYKLISIETPDSDKLSKITADYEALNPVFTQGVIVRNFNIEEAEQQNPIRQQDSIQQQDSTTGTATVTSQGGIYNG